MRPSSLADPLVLGFILMPMALAAVFVWGVSAAWRRSGQSEELIRRAASTATLGAAAWLAATDLTARSGVLRQWDTQPPPLALFVIAIVALAVTLALGPVGRRFGEHLPLWVVVGVQSFRWPLEVMMHSAYERGIMPVQMSYSGRNFDIVTGISALVVAALIAAGMGHRWLVLAWNVVGFALLLNIVAVAVISTPVVAFFGEQQLNTFVTYPPFVWLPGVMVLAALTGHLIIFRRLAHF